MDNTRTKFEEAQVGDVVICYDENLLDQTEHKMVITSIEDDEHEVCESNPLGRKLYGDDMSDEAHNQVCMVHPGNFVSIRPIATDWRELYDYVYDNYFENCVELSSGFFNFNVKMPKKDILFAWKYLEEKINEDEVFREENGQIFDEEDFVPEGEYEDIYEGNCMVFLDAFNDPRFHRVAEGEEACFIY